MDTNTTYGYWRTVAACAGYTIPDNLPRPHFIGDEEVPKDLSELSIGQLIELGKVDDANADYRIMDIVMHMDKDTTDESPAIQVVPFISWVGQQVKKINDLFKRVSHRPTAKEKQAGIDRLQFGLFGMIDWYAKRMGITDHDEVLPVPWIRIYKCLQMDNEQANFEKRLNDISMREAKRRR